MDHGFTFRPNTQDASMFSGVVHANEYRLPDAFNGDELIVDIGMNIGSFCYAALSRGAGEVHGYEPDPSNFEAASKNLRQFGDRIHPHHAAIWRSDRPAEPLFLNHLDPDTFGDGKEALTACGHVFSKGSGTTVPAIPFDDMLRDLTRNGNRRIDLLKIDCEGAEYPILYTSKQLHLIDEIIGEYHNFANGYHPDHPFHHVAEEAKVSGYPRFHIEELVQFLKSQGFEVEYAGHPTLPNHIGIFFARRPRATTIRFGGKLRGLMNRLTRRRAS